MPTPLPDTKSWQPRIPKISSLIEEALSARCFSIEEAIRNASRTERISSIDAFESGYATEDIARESLRSLLPSRYHVTAGTIVDSSGRTAGDVDIVVFNSHWFPEVHAAATTNTRKKFLPFEGVYAVGEIKQTLTAKSLDEAMEKLVKCHRLIRMPTPRGRLTENRDSATCTDGTSNPLYSFVLGVAADEDFSGLIERFFDINRSLRRTEVIRALCVLGRGTVVWATQRENETKPALFMADDLLLPIVPAFFPSDQQGSSLYALLENLLLHLYHSVLAPEDVASRYGPKSRRVRVPKSLSVALSPDKNEP